MADVIVIEGNETISVESEQTQEIVTTGPTIVEVVTVGIQGPPGPPGVESGVTYVQDHEPIGAKDRESWYNPLTLQMKVFHDGAWGPVAPDGGHF